MSRGRLVSLPVSHGIPQVRAKSRSRHRVRTLRFPARRKRQRPDPGNMHEGSCGEQRLPESRAMACLARGRFPFRRRRQVYGTFTGERRRPAHGRVPKAAGLGGSNVTQVRSRVKRRRWSTSEPKYANVSSAGADGPQTSYPARSGPEHPTGPHRQSCQRQFRTRHSRQSRIRRARLAACGVPGPLR